MSPFGLKQISSLLILIKPNGLSSKKRFMPTKFPELLIDGITRERETVTKFLGVIIDENVAWKAHINTIPTKISKSIGILYRAGLIIPRKQLN